MAEHELKCWPAQFAALRLGLKTHEFRRNDRGFISGDTLTLNEYDPDKGYTGRTMSRVVTWVTKCEEWGGDAGFVCLSLSDPAAKAEAIRDLLTGETEGPFTVKRGWVGSVSDMAHGAAVVYKNGGAALWGAWIDSRGTPEQQAEWSTARARAVANALNALAALEEKA